VSVERDYALAVSDDTAELRLISNLSGQTYVTEIFDAVAGGDALGLSPSGSTAVAYSLDSSLIQVIGGLPLNPMVRFELHLGASSHALTALAVSDNEQVLAAFSNGETGTLQLFTAETAPRLIATVGLVSGITFSAAGDLALAADRAWNEVVLFENLSANATPIRLAGSADGISGPIGILLSADAMTAYVANEVSGTVTVVSLAGGAVRHVSCQCRPTTMRPLRGDSMFALTDRADEPIVLFDGEPSDPRILVVPAGMAIGK
jgi:hypothetical protein